MQVRVAIYGLVAAVVLGGVVFVADALVVTDEERLSGLADDLLEARGDGRPEALLRWTDLDRAPARVVAGRRARTFEAPSEDLDLADAVRGALAPLADARDVEEVQRTVRVEDDRATVALRARADGRVRDLALRLRRSGQGWVLTRIQLR